MPTEVYRLTIDELLAAGDEFFVAEGPFKTSSRDLILWADDVSLHVKIPPLAMGGRNGHSKLTLRFEKGGEVLYRVDLGRLKAFIQKINPETFVPSWGLSLSPGRIISLWRQAELDKTNFRRALDMGKKPQHKIERVLVEVPTTTVQTVKVDTFDEMTDLEVLERLNKRNAKYLKPRDGGKTEAPVTAIRKVA